ncbi:palmitoyltransferase pfa4 [Drechmeria coniospora]|uniref:Palmitoyltransferase n=1 Tax=Drechmeria coniospora TaxID=98403 RepID=A0A151GHY9_DRECN|nr:palmitoyltransferase pfa4 [Drechmeria coniospora]KYK56698.1 palmitoyltransferase pfa4 [Drechmeria coniospora]
MDHHCPWTRNCVSMTTFPHFLRFLVYANLSLWALGRLLYQRLFALWEARHLPAYLGPSLEALVALALMSLICFFTTLALGIMLISTLKSWLFNCTTIESWEIDRHEAVLDRGGRRSWNITGPDGENIIVERVEFPYDIGFFANMAQAMGTSNPLLWLFPLAGHPELLKDAGGWVWAENGFNHREGMWPPPDPEKISRAARSQPLSRKDYNTDLRDAVLSPEEWKRAFKERQERDARHRKMILAELDDVNAYEVVDMNIHGGYESDECGSHEWVNHDGDRLQDYGVDEEAENVDTGHPNCDDDNVPLGELLRRRRVLLPSDRVYQAAG